MTATINWRQVLQNAAGLTTGGARIQEAAKPGLRAGAINNLLKQGDKIVAAVAATNTCVQGGDVDSGGVQNDRLPPPIRRLA